MWCVGAGGVEEMGENVTPKERGWTGIGRDETLFNARFNGGNGRGCRNSDGGTRSASGWALGRG